MPGSINGTEVGASGGGSSLPATPADALLDVASPSTFVVLDPAGVGAAITPADARAALYPLTPVTTASGWTTGGTGGTVTQGASTLALTITSGQSGVQTDAYVPYATKATTAGPRKRLRFRVAMTPAGTVTNVILWVGFGTAAGTARGPAVYALIRGDGLVELGEQAVLPTPAEGASRDRAEPELPAGDALFGQSGGSLKLRSFARSPSRSFALRRAGAAHLRFLRGEPAGRLRSPPTPAHSLPPSRCSFVRSPGQLSRVGIPVDRRG